jgi:hypothetical protein
VAVVVAVTQQEAQVVLAAVVTAARTLAVFLHLQEQQILAVAVVVGLLQHQVQVVQVL